MAATPGLVVLEYDFCCSVRYDEDPTIETFACNGLELALAHVKKTLQELRVSIHSYPCSPDYNEDLHPSFTMEGVLSTLKDFDRLIEIEVPFSLLLRPDFKCVDPMVDNLPPNIKSVILRDDMASWQVFPWGKERVLKCLPEYLQLWTVRNQSLGSVGLNIEEFREDWDELALENFRMLCMRKSITPLVYKKCWRAFFKNPSRGAPMVIANLVLYYMYVDRAKLLNQQAGPEISSMTVCANDPVPSRQGLLAPLVVTSDGLTCTSPCTVACATFTNKRDVPPATMTAPALSRRQGPGVVPFHSNPPGTVPSGVPTGPATTCSCTA